MEKYLRMCLDSVVNQSLKDIEIILIDDGSTDSSPDIISEYVERYPNLITAYREKNAGQGHARNYGISLTHGEYIGFVDADDYIEKSMYENMYRLAKETDSDLVECDYAFLREQGGKITILPKYGVVKARSEKKELFVNPLVSPWNKLIRGDLLRNSGVFFPEEVIFEDTSFYIKLIPHIQKFNFIPEVYVKHFKRVNSTMTGNTGAKAKRNADIFKVLEDIVDYYSEKEFLADYMEEIEYFSVKILLCSSLERIATIDDSILRKEMVAQTWEMIRKYFPNYKNNRYMNGGTKNLYMKCSSYVVSRLFVKILRFKNK